MLEGHFVVWHGQVEQVISGGKQIPNEALDNSAAYLVFSPSSSFIFRLLSVSSPSNISTLTFELVGAPVPCAPAIARPSYKFAAPAPDGLSRFEAEARAWACWAAAYFCTQSRMSSLQRGRRGVNSIFERGDGVGMERRGMPKFGRRAHGGR